MMRNIRVTVWNEFLHEKRDAKVAAVYPEGIHAVLAKALAAQQAFEVRTATLEEPEHGLAENVLNATDVVVWWGHMAHDDVSDAVVERVHRRVLEGMGLVVLHSAHFSKIFRRLMGTTCNLKWREAGEKERLWVVARSHPIAEGIDEYFELPHTETYGEPFDIPPPDELVFISWFQGGEVFRSGCCFLRGSGKVFYFRPGHETLPIYYDANVQRVIANAVRWAAPVKRPGPLFGNVKPLEKLT
ncbi:MAG: ThuA domain-containing protein [Candidatus Bathyarchaeia archaeon]